MNDNDIIKLLKTCSVASGCKDCRFADSTDCAGEVSAMALDLINRHKAEIERLTVNTNAFGLGMKREKERADTARAEAIKEFAERMKDLLDGKTDPMDEYDIDEIAQEMTEGRNEHH